MSDELILPGSEAENAAIIEAARDIVAAVERGIDGRWRMPWHAFARRPTNAFSGRTFKGQNVLSLWAAARKKRFQTHLWASPDGWAANGASPAAGEQGTPILVPVFKDGPGRRWSADDAPRMARKIGPIGGDPEGGMVRELLGFRREPWFAIEQVSPAPSTVIDNPLPQPDEACLKVQELLGRWRRNRGPQLIHGGVRAFWAPDIDRITMPMQEAFQPRLEVSGLQYYVGTLVHEHVHATGSRSRLARNMSGKFGSPSYAKEELIAEFGASFLCAEFGLPASMRDDHARYVDAWLSALKEKTQRPSLLWALSEAEKAVEFIKLRAAAG